MPKREFMQLLAHDRALLAACRKYGACKLSAMIQDAYTATESPEIELLCEELMRSLKRIARRGYYYGYTLDFKLV